MESRCFSNRLLSLIVLLLAFIALRPYGPLERTASADSGRFDYIHCITPVFLYKGKQGLLLLDKRNGNVWFVAKSDAAAELSYGAPVLLTQIPLEKLE